MWRLMLTFAAWLAASLAIAQDYPAKPVRIVVAFPPGSSTDILTRTVAQKLGELWNQAVVIENRGGAGGNLGAQTVTRAPNDGYTLLATSNAMAINLTLFKEPGFRERDLAPIVRMGETSAAIVIHPSIPANNVRELLELSKQQPLSYASAGTGTGGHILMEWLKKRTGVDITHVPFAPATAANAVVGNQAAIGLISVPPITPHLKAGKARALAVTSAQRAAALPDVPTVAESGYPGFFDILWLALFAPAGTSPGIVAKINADTNRVLELPDVRERLTGMGVETRRNSVAEWEAEFRSEVEKFRKVIPEIGVKAE